MTTKSSSFSLHPLEKGFVGPKPIEEAPLSTFYDLEVASRLIVERKRNGHCSYTTITGQACVPHIYSSGINQLTEKLPVVVDGLRALNLPKDTLLVAELLVEKNGVDDLGSFGSIAQSRPERAIELQKSTPVQLQAFNIIVHRGKNIIHYPYQDRLDLLRELFAKRESPLVRVVDVLTSRFDDARAEVLRNKWEGLVLYDKLAGSAFRTDGITERPLRPVGCWKWKPYSESDFIATGWIPSTSNKFKGQVRDLLIAQYDPITNELVHWGKVGIGLSSAERREYANDALYPMVFEIKFERRTPNKRLINAQILRRRFDKDPRECYTSKTCA